MKASRVFRCLPLSLLLSCSLAPKSVAAAPVQTEPEEGQFEAIRFGDAEELAYDAPFFPGANYDASVPTPDSILGQLQGTRLSHPAEIVRGFEAIAEQSERVTFQQFGQTHEGRPLVYLVVTSPANHSRIDEIREGHAKLADPRLASAEELDELARSLPPVAWMGYSIHGDELSGSDAGFALAYHLAACTDDEVVQLLEDLVIVIDPCLNPDGRERIIGMVEQSAGYTPNLDYASMHRGHWPYGRGNHYLFDMNRDWMAGTQPETRARWAAVLDWNPQLFVDAHEMSGLDTFLFYPQADPINPAFSDTHIYWQDIFADEAGARFDAHGWGYYSREWADGWAPFYSDAWAALVGSIGILYEQARTDGFQLRRASGQILTYREAVHHQLTASWANLESLRGHAPEVMASYLANKRKNVAADTEGNDQVLVVRADGNQDRLRRLQRILEGQRIEYGIATQTVQLSGVSGAHGETAESLELPAGSWVIPARQAQRQLVRAFFDFDQRIDLATLEKEREELERRNSSKMYDLTGWSLPHALDLDAYWGSPSTLDVADVEPLTPDGRVDGPAPEGYPTYAWVVDGRDDSAVAFAARAMEFGLQVHLSDKAFQDGAATEREWSRGSLLIRRHENDGSADEIEARVERASRESGAVATRVLSGRAPGEGPDLGGGHFHLLARPRIALVANAPVSSDTYGHLWHHLDVELGVPFSIIDAQSLGRTDLRRYNVLVLPPGGLSGLVSDMKESLGEWVASGGTLIGVAGSAAMLTSSRAGLSSVSLRRNALDKLDEFALAVERERASRLIVIDEELVWEGTPTPGEDVAEQDDDEAEAPAKEKDGDKALDAWRRRFSPNGANLLADIDDESWLTIGSGDVMPVSLSGSNVYLSKPPVQTPVRFTEPLRLRLAGLLWPEARERIADSAYLTREGRGAGQVILFAGMPAFRGYHQATARLFSNAVIYGPGMGSSQPIGW